jgi:SH3 domain protein
MVCALLLSPVGVQGKSLYVSGYREVTMRTTPSAEGEIMVTLKTGDEVSLVGNAGDYYLVTFRGGSRGYVPKSAMTEQEPAELRLQKLDQKTQQQIKELQAKTEEQERQLAALRQERKGFEDAKKQAEANAQEQAKLASDLQARQEAVERDFYIRWFIAGAVALLTGLAIGWMWGSFARRSRRGGLSVGRF